MRRPTALLPWALPVFAAALTLIFYGPSLSFPLYWDDAANFRFFDPRTFTQVWTDAGGFPYYRPAVFSLWKLLTVALGRGQTVVMHSLNLIAHAANGWLSGELARRLWRGDDHEGWTIAFVAAALSVLFPFAPLAVSLPASLFHLSLLTVTLATVLALVLFSQSERRRWLVLGLGGAALAPFVHEAGATTGTIAAAMWWFQAWPGVRRRDAVLGALAVALGVAFIPVWLAVPKARGGFEWVGWTSLQQSARFFLEGFTFPIQPLARPLMRLSGWDDLTSVAALGLLALVAGALLAWRAGRARMALAGFAWYWLASLPSILVLGFAYIVTSTRLMVFPSGGAVLFWAAAVVATAKLIGVRAGAALRRDLLPIAAAALAIVILAVPAVHVVRVERLHARSLGMIWNLTRIAQARPGERQLIVNPLDWLARRESTYAVGHEGVEMKASYVSLNDLAYINGAANPDLASVLVESLNPDLPDFWYGMVGPPVDEATFVEAFRGADAVWALDFSGEAIRIHEAGAVSAGTPGRPRLYLAEFGNETFLLDASLSVIGDRADMSLVWQHNGPAHDGIAFAHVFDCAGNLLGLADGPPIARLYSFSLARPGDHIRDFRHVRLDALAADGCYYAEFGLFHASDGTRLPATAPDGSRLENDLVSVVSSQ